jgi:succinyl-CoA synthetase beta subunit
MQLKSPTRPAPKARRCAACYIEEGADIKKEYYVSLVTDRATQKVALIASSEGGMDIEEVAHSTPEKIITGLHRPADRPDRRAGQEDRRRHRPARGSHRPGRGHSAEALQVLHGHRRSLVEINPLNCEGKGNLMALDAKFNFDANALFRHPEIVAYRDLDEEDPAESKPPSSTWPTSAWTATSAAWSTAPAWPWPPWTPSSCSAASRPTSWTWAAAPPPRR